MVLPLLLLAISIDYHLEVSIKHIADLMAAITLL